MLYRHAHKNSINILEVRNMRRQNNNPSLFANPSKNEEDGDEEILNFNALRAADKAYIRKLEAEVTKLSNDLRDNYQAKLNKPDQTKPDFSK